MSEKMAKFEKKFGKKPVAPSPKKDKKEELQIIEGMGRQLQNYGRTIPHSKLQQVYDWVFMNKVDLVSAVDNFLRTWNNPTRKIVSGGLVERRNIRMQVILDFLKELKKNGNKNSGS